MCLFDCWLGWLVWISHLEHVWCWSGPDLHPFETNTKTCLENKFQTRPLQRLVLDWKFCQNQDQFLVLKSITKVCLENQFQARPIQILVLNWKFCQDQNQCLILIAKVSIFRQIPRVLLDTDVLNAVNKLNNHLGEISITEIITNISIVWQNH